MGKKNDEFSFSVKLIPKLVRLGQVGFMLANAVVFYSGFSFKISNAAITNYGLEFDSIAAVLDNGIRVFYFCPRLLPPHFSHPPHFTRVVVHPQHRSTRT